MQIACSSSKSTWDTDLVASDDSCLTHLFPLVIPTPALPPHLTLGMLLSAAILPSIPFIYLLLVWTHEFLAFFPMVYTSLLFLSLLLKLSQNWSVGAPFVLVIGPIIIVVIIIIPLSGKSCSRLICIPVLEPAIFLKSPGSCFMGSGIRDQDLGAKQVAFIVCGSGPFRENLEIYTCTHKYIYANLYTHI